MQKAAADADVPYQSMEVLGVGAGTTAIAALEQGQVAAGMVLQPTLAELLKQGYNTVHSPDFPFVSITALAKPDWVSDNRSAMAAFLEGLATAHTESQSDDAFAVDAMRESDFRGSDDVLTEAVAFTFDMAPPGLTVDEAAYQSTTGVLLDVGLYEQADIVAFSEAFDFRLLPTQ